MEKILKTRHGQLLGVVMLMFIVLFMRLVVITLIQEKKWKYDANELSTKNIYTKAPRGEILDRYGRVLADNTQAFTLQMSAINNNRNIKNEDEFLNESCLSIYKILEKNNDEIIDNFPIIINQNKYEYTFQNNIEDWLEENEMPKNFTAKESFRELKKRYGIYDGISKYEAQKQLQNLYKVYPPISVKNMVYIENLNKESFLGRYSLDKKTLKEKKEKDTELDAEEAFIRIRKEFKISSKLNNIEARKIMVIRNELRAMGYRKYLPADISKNISKETIIEIKENSMKFPQVRVVSESLRNYPNNNTASHILGYLGKISEHEKKHYVDELGYSSNDLIGKDGIEEKFENYLKGRDGTKKVQVNAVGEYVRTLEEKSPIRGKKIYLTIDLDLQKVAEKALEQGLKKIQQGGTFQSKYGNYNFSKPYRNANVGAIVALEVETGEVLAMASYPDYNPNLFSNGINKEDWSALQTTNPRDYMAPAPLYNVAARTAVQPGSTFKPITGIAAMECGLDPNRKIFTNGMIPIGTSQFGCLIWNMRHGRHGYLNLAEALEVSCNYYFYDVATGRDFARGKSLGYKKPIDISVITNYAKQFGLGVKSGIEISESVKPVPTEKEKIEIQKSKLRYELNKNSEKYFIKSIYENPKLLNKSINNIVSWTEENPSKRKILDRFENRKLGISPEKADELADLCKFTYFKYAGWNLSDKFNIAIGQGENSYTPLQMANYMATLGNDGVRNKVSLIKAIENENNNKKNKGIKVKLEDDNHLNEAIKGLKKVATGSRGSLRGSFAKFPIPVAGKTGTAERDGKMHPPDELEYIKKYLNRINPKLKWDEVEAEMNRILHDKKEDIHTKEGAVRKAIINLSGDKMTYSRIDIYKNDYDNFAWVVAMAPADDPKIAVAVMVVQGGRSTYAGPIAREVIGEYLKIDNNYNDYTYNTTIR